MTECRSAFEAWPGGSHRSTSSIASTGSESESPGYHKRIVGFPAVLPPPAAAAPLTREPSPTWWTAEDRPLRQSSLGKQLQLYSFEQQQKPRLPTINTRATRQRARVPPRGVTRQPSVQNRLAPRGSSASGDGDKSFSAQSACGPELSSTMPSDEAGLLRRSSTDLSTEARAIPVGLTKAYTAPEQLPELSPEMQRLFASNAASSFSKLGTREPQQLQPAQGALQPSRMPSPVSGRSPQQSGFIGAPHLSSADRSLAQMVSLREALRKEQDEVSRLRRELAKLTAKDLNHARSSSSGGDPGMSPVTPNVPEQNAPELHNEDEFAAREGAPDEWSTPFGGFAGF